MVKISGIVLGISLLLLSIFHFLILIKILPSDIVWGGNLTDHSSIILVESFSLLVTLFMILVTAIQSDLLKIFKLKKIAGIIIWFMAVYFLLNIIANLAAKTITEKLIFVPVAMIMFISSLILGLKDKIIKSKR